MGALFSKPAAPPPAPDPVPMPDLYDPAILLAKKRAIDRAATSSGRASTVLSGGQGTYNGNKLGTA